MRTLGPLSIQFEDDNFKYAVVEDIDPTRRKIVFNILVENKFGTRSIATLDKDEVMREPARDAIIKRMKAMADELTQKDWDRYLAKFLQLSAKQMIATPTHKIHEL